ncbi:MAG: hypothetical protein IKP92_00950, partial [Lachnospiraceae bacterium]|nr:hypothetical protein [Lachnospiraceae bacterium]
TIAEMTYDALDKDVLAREYINRKEKINECGRVICQYPLNDLYLFGRINLIFSGHRNTPK